MKDPNYQDESLKLMDTEEAAVFLTIKPNTLEIWRMKNIGPDYLKIGGAVRYRVSDLRKFIDASTQETFKP